jgi:hypothetical protein
VKGPQGCLDGECRHEPEEQQLLDRGVRIACGIHQSAEVECAVAARARRNHEEADHRGEHDEAAEQVVQQELQGGLRAVPAPVPTDEKVERDQRGLEDDVEEQNVERHE